MNNKTTKQTELPMQEYSLDALVANAVALLRHHEPPAGYVGSFSGGKDSCIIKWLANEAGVNVRWQYNVTTIDPPEVIYFMREHHADVEFVRPTLTMMQLFRLNGNAPTRRIRYCCAHLKEKAKPGRSTIIGIRAEESPRRAASWNEVTIRGKRNPETLVLPILSWRLCDVWQLIESTNMPYCGLYDEGWDRLGCIGCPMTNGKYRQMEFDRWPGYERLWRKTFERVWNERRGTTNSKGFLWMPSRKWDCWEQWWDWWMTV